MSGSFKCVTQLFGDGDSIAAIQEKTKPIAEKEGFINDEKIRIN